MSEREIIEMILKEMIETERRVLQNVKTVEFARGFSFGLIAACEGIARRMGVELGEG